MEHQGHTAEEFKINLHSMNTEQPRTRDYEAKVPAKLRKKVVSHTTNTPVIQEFSSHLPKVITKGQHTRSGQPSYEQMAIVRNYNSLQSSELLSPNSNPLN